MGPKYILMQEVNQMLPKKSRKIMKKIPLDLDRENMAAHFALE